MDDLLSALNEAQSIYKEIREDLEESRNMLGVSSANPSKEASNPKSGPTFSKQSRFPQSNSSVLGKNNGEASNQISEFSYSTSNLASMTSMSMSNGWANASKNSKVNEKKKPTFPKAERFQKNERSLNESRVPLNPKFDFVKPKTKSTVIPPPSKGKKGSQANNDDGESFVSEAETTATGVSESVGPGRYSVEFGAIEQRAPQVRFPKSSRFKEQPKETIRTIIIDGSTNPSLEAVKPKVKSIARLHLPMEKGKGLKIKEETEKELEIRRAEMDRAMMEEKEKKEKEELEAIKAKSKAMAGGKELTKKERMIQMFKLLDQIKEMKRGPGRYDLAVPAAQGPCLVKYRSDSHSPPRSKMAELIRMPGPGSHDPNYDAVKAKAPNVKFGKESKEKKKTLDLRKALNVNYKLVRSHSVGAIIMPEHSKHHVPIDFAAMRRGPGKYDVNFDQIEERRDKGLVPYQKLTKENERMAEAYAKKDPDEAQTDINPDVALTKPRAPAAFIKEPLQGLEPPNIPDAILYPEHWRLYDPNGEATREHVPEANFARGIPFEQFKLKEEEFETLRDYLARKNKKKPAPGQYQVEYKAVEKEIPGGFIRQAGLYDNVSLDDQEEGKKGDFLKLNPEQPKAHVPGFNIGKVVGRNDNEEVKDDPNDVNYQPLILSPKDIMTKPKAIMMVDMSRGAREICIREIKPSDPEFEEKSQNIPDLKHGLVEPKTKVLVNYSKEQGRKDPLKALDPDRDEAIVSPNHKLVKPKVPGGVINRETGVKSLKNEADEPVVGDKTEQRIDIDKALEAVRPKPGALKFEGYSGREKTETKPKPKE